LGAVVKKGAVAIILGLMAPNDVAAEPQVLADWELDSITAAGVLVDVNSIAAALGDFGRANTGAKTFVFDGRTLDLGIGVTIGQSLACCGKDADVEVDSTVLGSGDYVRGTMLSVEHDGTDRRRWAHGTSLGFILAISFEGHSAVTRDAHLAMLEDLRAALDGFRIELPDGPSGSDLSDDRWSHLIGVQ
jgi:hypothetical protein